MNPDWVDFNAIVVELCTKYDLPAPLLGQAIPIALKKITALLQRMDETIEELEKNGTIGVSSACH